MPLVKISILTCQNFFAISILIQILLSKVFKKLKFHCVFKLTRVFVTKENINIFYRLQLYFNARKIILFKI